MKSAIASLDRLNALSRSEAEEELLSCCGSREWARRMADARPFASEAEMAEQADRIWRALSRADWLEAFSAHPRIGPEKVTDLFNGTPQPDSKIDLSPFSRASATGRFRAWSRQEQAAAAGASPETLANLADANRDYEDRFGHIFIVCASGKNAAEMLALLESRLGNDPDTELAIAAEEQRKITRLRLQKLLGETG